MFLFGPSPYKMPKVKTIILEFLVIHEATKVSFMGSDEKIITLTDSTWHAFNQNLHQCFQPPSPPLFGFHSSFSFIFNVVFIYPEQEGKGGKK